MSLGKNIRRMRRDKGWSQGQLSERTGIRIGHISKLEQDEGDPKLSTLYKLMQAFSCSPDSLLMDTARVTTDAVLKQTLERATALPEENKRVIIEIVDKYCIACGMQIAFTQPDRPWVHIWTEPPKSVLEEPPDLRRSPPQDPPEDPTKQP
jgi:transcriptional regulator with XRE-family HTH domain